MPEINPPTPLKPLWPVRPDEHPPGKRRQQSNPEREDREPSNNDSGDDDRHVIDEFV